MSHGHPTGFPCGTKPVARVQPLSKSRWSYKIELMHAMACETRRNQNLQKVHTSKLHMIKALDLNTTFKYTGFPGSHSTSLLRGRHPAHSRGKGTPAYCITFT